MFGGGGEIAGLEFFKSPAAFGGLREDKTQVPCRERGCRMLPRLSEVKL